MYTLNTIDQAINDLKNGKVIIVVDDATAKTKAILLRLLKMRLRK